jgi:RNA polymerase sigma-70 factor (ECF subfamily)
MGSAADDSDGELLRRIAGRDHDAFDALYRRYVRPVYALALRSAGDCREAADATRRAFAAIWSSAARYVPERGGGARWLFTVACNAIADARASPEESWPAFRVHAAVVGLPEHERVPLELAYWTGRSRGEIADLLGLPVGTVETRIRSALRRLAARLDELGDRARA